jgi:hypothetical protein
MAQGIAYQQLGRRGAGGEEKSQIGRGKIPEVWRVQ